MVGIPLKRLGTKVIFYITDQISYIIDRSKAVPRSRYSVLSHSVYLDDSK